MKKLNIKRALRDRKMTQAELCRRTGILSQNMSPIINGNPTVKKLEDIAIAIGCDITDLFYPDPTEEAEKKEVPAGTESEGETLNATLRGDLPEGFIERDVNFVQQAEENQQQMIQTSTFCPHCGKKVRVGVVLLPEE